MNIGFIPPGLFGICRNIVERHHKEHGIGNLTSDIETAGNIAVIQSIPEAFAVLNSANLSYKIRKWCFLASIGAVCFAVVFPWWSLGILVPIFLTDRILAYREKNGWKSLSAVLLSLDFMANDFLGWGAVYPREKDAVLVLLKTESGSPETKWLDYYLPRRAGMEPSQLKAFEPSVPPK